MLIFWNLAGVPLSYCHCTIYLANHAPSVYRWNRFTLVALYVSYLFMYWVWDTTNSQKNRFRQQERGTLMERKTFPQLPWQTVKNPKTIKTKTGDSILVDGWCKSITFKLKPYTFSLMRATRWVRTEDPLHMRPLFCLDMGSHHWLSKSLSLVLSLVLRCDDCSQSAAGHSEV